MEVNSVWTYCITGDIAHERTQDLSRSRTVGPSLITTEDEVHESEQYTLPSSESYPAHYREDPHPRDEAADDTIVMDRGSSDTRSNSNGWNPST